MQSTKSLGFRRHSFIGLLWRSMITGLGNVLLVVVGGTIAGGVVLPVARLGARVDPNEALFRPEEVTLSLGRALR